MKREGRTRVMFHNLLLRNYNYNCNEIFIHRLYILYKVEIIFPLLHYQPNFFHLCA